MGGRGTGVAEQSGRTAKAEAERAPAGQADLVIDVLWLATLQAIGGRAAHEVRGALNAVSVNLEVARSRSEKIGVSASTLTPFATTAAAQLENVIAMTEALMALVRSARGPIDLGADVGRVAGLVAPSARALGRSIELDHSIGGLGTTSASSSSARLAIGHCLLAAVDASTDVRCVAGPGERCLRVEHRAAGVGVDGDVVAALSAAGIRVETEASAIVITFPR
ncbi:MAG: hypothetical protein ACREPM_19605 [Gemmatimonadaceae bacterium]